MDILQNNMRFLRTQKNMTQQEFADLLKIKRSSIGAYEEGRARPNLDVQKIVAKIFGISLDQLLTKDLKASANKKNGEVNIPKSMQAGNLRVLSVTVDSNGNENIELVSQKAAAGYLNGYSDPEFVSTLPKFKLPFLPAGTYRAFEISGDSMLPLQPGSIVIGEYLSDISDVKDGRSYVVLTKQDGIVYKRIFSKSAGRELVLRSDNPSYPPFEVEEDDILELWRAKLFITRAGTENPATLEKMMSMLSELQQAVTDMKPVNAPPR